MTLEQKVRAWERFHLDLRGVYEAEVMAYLDLAVLRDTYLKSLERTEPKTEDSKEDLCALLTVIHRDGGHYIAEHGIKKAVEDAINIVVAHNLNPVTVAEVREEMDKVCDACGGSGKMPALDQNGKECKLFTPAICKKCFGTGKGKGE